MKTLKLILALILLGAATAAAQEKMPVVKSNSRIISVQSGTVLQKDNWTLQPESKPDVLETAVFDNKPIKVTFITDIDSISFNVEAGKKYDFIIQWNGQACYTQIVGKKFIAPKALSFTERKDNLPFVFQFQSPNDAYLKRLRTEYKLDEVVAGKRTQYEKVRAISKWVNSRWQHDSENQPQHPDAISILQEAAQGKRFRCVEYSTVLAAALNSVGIPARSLGLQTKDVEIREIGAGHVVAEAYLSELDKWIMVDGQADAIPTLRGKPLNAVEFQAALARRDKHLSVDSSSPFPTNDYFLWIAPNLYYFISTVSSPTNSDWRNLYLKPIGAKDVKVFQKTIPIENAVFTTSLNTFYAKPKI